ncbi:Exodeoxyribonuclease 7 small subunit [Planctomycetes bacterium CA13]|uniref:Exodeoxyribonuclease 7 small subunit n=1 Tax=Novipirellula herctigrandis TaxID=2527986 RepID=A0A5C5YWA3_9BACT|nr:Exodeoxyribonuclease 7 small subunit [Planctomycetes bacterium CA13]
MAKKKRSPSDSDEGTNPDEMDFESAIGEVEGIVHELESGELGLTESLNHYEVGIKRLNECHKLLQSAERKISLLSGFDSDGNPLTEPFDDDAEVSPNKAGRKNRNAKSKTNKTTSTNPSSKKTRKEDFDDDAGDDDDVPGLF